MCGLRQESRRGEAGLQLRPPRELRWSQAAGLGTVALLGCLQLSVSETRMRLTLMHPVTIMGSVAIVTWCGSAGYSSSFCCASNQGVGQAGSAQVDFISVDVLKVVLL